MRIIYIGCRNAPTRGFAVHTCGESEELGEVHEVDANGRGQRIITLPMTRAVEMMFMLRDEVDAANM